MSAGTTYGAWANKHLKMEERAAKKKAEWLAYCLEIGFIEKSQLDELSAIWDKFKDEHGNLRPAPSVKDLPNLSKSTENLSKIVDKDKWLDEVRGREASEESTWEIVLRRMKHKNLFDDKFNSNTLEFAYAFQMGFKAAGTQQKKVPVDNKELISVIETMLDIYRKYANDNPAEDHYAEHAEDVLNRIKRHNLSIPEVQGKEADQDELWAEVAKMVGGFESFREVVIKLKSKFTLSKQMI